MTCLDAFRQRAVFFLVGLDLPSPRKLGAVFGGQDVMLHAVKVQVQVEVKVGDAFAESRSFLALNTASKNQSAVLVCVDAIAKSHQTLVLKLVGVIDAEEMKGPAQIMLGPMKPCLVGSVLVSVETKESGPRPDKGVKLTCNGRPIAPLAANGQYVDRPAKAFLHIQQE